MSILSRILQHRLVAIIRGADPKDMMAIAGALLQGGIAVLEITLNSREALPSIERLVRNMGDQMLIGAGTVMDAASAKSAIACGASFIISPHTDPAIIEMTRSLGAVSIPGALTPNEILSAHNHGGEIIKIFPGILGPGYIRDLRAALPPMPMMPTGGISAENIVAFRDAGAAAFGVGNALFNAREEISGDYWNRLAQRAEHLVTALS